MNAEASQVWRNGSVPVVYRPEGKRPIFVRVPYREDNREWLQGNGRNIRWNKDHKCWVIPRSRTDDVVSRAIQRHGQCYLIQAFRSLEVCAPACWEAEGVVCECSCAGENHGSGSPLAFVVGETFAFEWGPRRYSCRLLKRRGAANAARRG